MKRAWKNLTVNITEEDYRWLRKLAGERGVSMSGLLRAIIRELVSSSATPSSK
jgi:hypothetical protein